MPSCSENRCERARGDDERARDTHVTRTPTSGQKARQEARAGECGDHSASVVLVLNVFVRTCSCRQRLWYTPIAVETSQPPKDRRRLADVASEENRIGICAFHVVEKAFQFLIINKVEVDVGQPDRSHDTASIRS